MKVEDDMSESMEAIFLDDTSEDKGFNIILLLATSVIGSWLTLIIAAMSPNVGWAGLFGAYVFGGMIGVVVGVFILMLFGLSLLPQSGRTQHDKNKELI
jgi:dipeptide/tripeptide permease